MSLDRSIPSILPVEYSRNLEFLKQISMMIAVRNAFNKLPPKPFGMHDSQAQLSGPGARDDITLNNSSLVYAFLVCNVYFSVTQVLYYALGGRFVTTTDGYFRKIQEKHRRRH